MGKGASLSRVACGVALWMLVSLAFAEQLERQMLTHVLVQLPALVVAGGLIVPRPATPGHRPFAIPALLVAVFAAAVWMLPRTLDAALAEPRVNGLKYATVPLLIGLPLAWAWPRLSGLTRAFVWANVVSMLIALGWLYKVAPTRVCNYYLQREQDELGTALLIVASAIVVTWCPRFFVSGPRRSTPSLRGGARGRSSARSAGIPRRVPRPCDPL